MAFLLLEKQLCSLYPLWCLFSYPILVNLGFVLFSLVITMDFKILIKPKLHSLISPQTEGFVFPHISVTCAKMDHKTPVWPQTFQLQAEWFIRLTVRPELRTRQRDGFKSEMAEVNLPAGALFQQKLEKINHFEVVGCAMPAGNEWVVIVLSVDFIGLLDQQRVCKKSSQQFFTW